MDAMLSAVDWKPTGAVPNDEGLPFATHEGELYMLGHTFRCYQLNTGVRVFDADDVANFFSTESDA